MNTPNENDYVPNPKLHLGVSIIKSILRIIAGAALCNSAFMAAGIFLIAAEILGIVEELV